MSHFEDSKLAIISSEGASLSLSLPLSLSLSHIMISFMFLLPCLPLTNSYSSRTRSQNKLILYIVPILSVYHNNREAVHTDIMNSPQKCSKGLVGPYLFLFAFASWLMRWVDYSARDPSQPCCQGPKAMYRCILHQTLQNDEPNLVNLLSL